MWFALEILPQLLAALASLLGGAFVSSDRARHFLQRFGLVKPVHPEMSYSERLSDLTSKLTAASREVDSVLAELARVARDREMTAASLQTDLTRLERREEALTNRINALRETPVPVVKYFADVLEERDKRSARRDYALFGAGVGVTTIVAILIQVAIP